MFCFIIKEPFVLILFMFFSNNANKVKTVKTDCCKVTAVDGIYFVFQKPKNSPGEWLQIINRLQSKLARS